MALALAAAADLKVSGGNNTNTLTTASFTPAAAETLVCKVSTWGNGAAMGAPTGGGLTWTKRAERPLGGFNGYVAIYTATVGGSPSSMTVASTPDGSCQHMLVLERWTGATLAVTPATNSTKDGSGLPAASVTTVAAGSVLTWVSVDLASADPVARAYLLSATESGLLDAHLGFNSVHYSAWASLATAQAYTIGMSAPGSQTWAMVGIEIQAAGLTVALTPALLTLTAPEMTPGTSVPVAFTPALLSLTAPAMTVTTGRPAAASTGGSWYTLLDIYAEAAQDAAYYRDAVPQACPNDGEPLTGGPGGVLFCRFDGWQYPRDWIRPGY